MTDQCKHCELRGNIKKCKETECFHHENWYAIEQQKMVDDLSNKLDQAISCLDVDGKAKLLKQWFDGAAHKV